MLRLSKKVEYGILALQYIARNSDKKVSAKEMSDSLNISFEFLSKTLQKLMKSGLIISRKGIHGGYTLAKEPGVITLADVIVALDENTSIVNCFDHNHDVSCERDDDCSLKGNMIGLQNQINKVFKNMTIAEMSSNNN